MSDHRSEVSPEVAQRLRAYGALDNPIRLRAYRIVHDAPEVSFNDLARKLNLASGLAAYHLGVLKSAGLVEVRYVRSGMATSRYALTALGARIFEDLFSGRRLDLRRLAKSTSKVLA